MKYFHLEGFIPAAKSYCFVSSSPSGIPPMYRNAPSVGQEVGEHFPTEPGAVSLTLDESKGGLDLPTFVANTRCLLLVSSEFSNFCTEHHDYGDGEVLPVKLVTKKGRDHSDEYRLLNPIGTVDCMDQSRSDITKTESGDIVLINAYALFEKKIPEGKDIFRIPEMPEEYFFSERLIDSIRKNSFTNFTVSEVKVVS